MRGLGSTLALPPDVALAYCEQMRVTALRWQREAEARARACEDERERRESAEDLVEELQVALDDARRESARRDLEVEALQESVASGGLEKGLVERRLARALDEIERLRREQGGDEDAVRRRVLKTQALRARLGKTNMSPWSRMQTLQSAEKAGIELDGEQLEELMDLQLRYG